MIVQFSEQLAHVLPADLPHRDRVLAVAARHLESIVAANEYMNLTRITDPGEAAIKHVYDCLAPWRFFKNAGIILDAGTGAGFPGVPLSAVFPESQFTLAESVGKKARFIESVVDDLKLANVSVKAERAESLTAILKPVIITARAMAPLSKLVDLFQRALNDGVRLLLYKGPEIESEFAQLPSNRFSARVLDRYDLPSGMGSRTFVEVTAQRR